jgi:hypothetical protein
MNLKKIGKLFTSKFVGTGPSTYKKKEFTGPRSHKGWETLLYDSIVIRVIEAGLDKYLSLRLNCWPSVKFRLLLNLGLSDSVGQNPIGQVASRNGL